MEIRSASASRARFVLVALLGLAAVLALALAACSANNNNNNNTSTESQYSSQFESLKKGDEFPVWASTLEGDGSKAVIPGLANTNVGGEGCDRMVPQGLCKASEYLLISAVDENDKDHEQHDSVIYVMDYDSGSYLYTLVLGGNTSHVGGLASDGENVYIADGSAKAVWELPLSVLRAQGETGKDSCEITLEEKAGKISTNELEPSFLTYHDGVLYVGHFSEKTESDNCMYGYDPGTGCVVVNKTKLPFKTQGVAFVERDGATYLICSTSYNRNNEASLYVYRATFSSARSLHLDQAGDPVKWPNMSEDIECVGDTLLVAYESAANKYQNADGKGACPYPIDRVTRHSVENIIAAAGAITEGGESQYDTGDGTYCVPMLYPVDYSALTATEKKNIGGFGYESVDAASMTLTVKTISNSRLGPATASLSDGEHVFRVSEGAVFATGGGDGGPSYMSASEFSALVAGVMSQRNGKCYGNNLSFVFTVSSGKVTSITASS